MRFTHAQHPICFSADGVLFCRECSTPISGIGPAAGRVCKAAGREADRELGLLANGMNAGDQYNREDGRIAALRDALPKPNDGPARPEGVPPGYHGFEALQRKAFVNAAIEAYLNRARKGSDRTRKAGK